MRRVVKLARARRRRVRPWRDEQPTPTDLPVVELGLPVILPGERAPAGVGEIERLGPDVSLRIGGSLFYGPDGEPIDDSDLLEATRQVEAAGNAPGGHLRSSRFYRASRRIEVRTDYLGLDLGGFGRLPLVWETMVFAGEGHFGGLGWPADCWRYATTAAARHGHYAVVSALREQQRARRSAWRNRHSRWAGQCTARTTAV